MKKFFMFLLIASTVSVYAQVPYDEIPAEYQEEAIYPDENYEKQEDPFYPAPSESSEDLMAEDEAYAAESDYNY